MREKRESDIYILIYMRERERERERGGEGEGSGHISRCETHRHELVITMLLL